MHEAPPVSPPSSSPGPAARWVLAASATPVDASVSRPRLQLPGLPQLLNSLRLRRTVSILAALAVAAGGAVVGTQLASSQPAPTAIGTSLSAPAGATEVDSLPLYRLHGNDSMLVAPDPALAASPIASMAILPVAVASMIGGGQAPAMAQAALPAIITNSSEPATVSPAVQAPARPAATIEAPGQAPTTETPAAQTAPAIAADTTPAATSPADPTGSVSAGVESIYLGAINSVRRDHGLAPLIFNGTIAAIAGVRSGDMAAGGYFAHVSPGGDTWLSLLGESGHPFSAGGENLARIYGDPAESVAAVIEQFMASPMHRANILNEDFQWAGLNSMTGPDGVTILTVIFTN